MLHGLDHQFPHMSTQVVILQALEDNILGPSTFSYWSAGPGVQEENVPLGGLSGINHR